MNWTKNRFGICLLLFLAAIGPAIGAAKSSQEHCLELLTNLLEPQPSVDAKTFDLRAVDETPEWLISPGTHTKKEDIDDQVRETLKRLNEPTNWLRDDPESPGPPFAVLQTIYDNVATHPVAALCHLKDNDPSGTIGFCFGRALAAHLEAMLNGVAEWRIKKIFIKGNFSVIENNKIEPWVYHAATIVRANDNQWYAIDPRMDGPQKVMDWNSYWQSFAKQGAYVYTTHPRRLYPSVQYYSLKMLEPPFYGSEDHERITVYFKQLLLSYREKALKSR